MDRSQHHFIFSRIYPLVLGNVYSSDPKKPTGVFRKAAVAFAVQHGALGNIKRKRNGRQVQGAMDEDGESDNAEGDENAEVRERHAACRARYASE